MIWKNPSRVILFSAFVFVFAAANAFGQVYSRPRIVPPSAAPAQAVTNAQTAANRLAPRTSQPASSAIAQQRPTLTNQIVVRDSYQTAPMQPLVKKTADVKPTVPTVVGSAPIYAPSLVYAAATNQRMISSIQEKIGIRYVYGTQGPNTYDCSGFVWSVFQSAGISFERGSARTLWANSVPVENAEKFKFGTLVFFNKLGHVGIVADENGFYHASSSKGITYSKFEGYWGKRIVGFRRLPNTGF